MKHKKLPRNRTAQKPQRKFTTSCIRKFKCTYKMIGNKINDNFHNNAELWKKDYK